MSLQKACFAVCGVWSLLCLGRVASATMRPEWATLVSFTAACGFVAWVGPRSRLGIGGLARSLAWLPAGYLALPAMLVCTWQLGLALGLPPDDLPPPLMPLHAGPSGWIAAVVMAPAFEEPLYRGIALQSLEGRIGRAGAVVVSSVLFALPHGGEWGVLNALLLGVGLGTMATFGLSIGACVALHAGLNLGCLVCGVPAVHLALSPAASGVFVSALTCGLLVFERVRCAPDPPLDAALHERAR